MPKTIGRDEVQRLADAGAIVAEVLPQPEYEWAHLAGAVHLPLRDLTAEKAAAHLEPDRPVIVYCHDLECDLSSRAAWHLEWLGYRRVYDYAASKMDWLSFGLPHEGNAELVGDVARRDIATCAPIDRIPDIRHLMDGQPICPVVNEQGIVIGSLSREDLDLHADATAGEAMEVGPKTTRPSTKVKDLQEPAQPGSRTAVLVTCSDGSIFGLFEGP